MEHLSEIRILVECVDSFFGENIGGGAELFGV